jgi:Xaa-Pro aminopeptidase
MKHFLIISILLSHFLFIGAQEKPDYNMRIHAFMIKLENGTSLIYASDQQGKINKNFYYLTGRSNLSMVLFLCPACEEKIMLFGDTIGENIFPQSQLIEKTRRPIMENSPLWFSFREINRIENLRHLVSFKKELKNADFLFYNMREKKEPLEIAYLTKAVEITADSYNYILKRLKPGITEQAIIDTFKQKQLDMGAQGTAFIQAGSGVNGTQIHARPSQKVMENGELVVFDVGAWYHGYTSDISRTFPVGGKFTRHQKEIYELVLKAQKAGIEKMLPGQIMYDVQKAVEDVLMEGLLKLGLVTDVNSEWQRGLYIVHGYYHYIGLDIHDCYQFMKPETGYKKYEQGMVMTMEPGLYFPPGLLDKKPNQPNLTDFEFETFVKATRENFLKYKNIGVRIEDDILITLEGNRILSAAVPKEIAEIEKIMKK